MSPPPARPPLAALLATLAYVALVAVLLAIALGGAMDVVARRDAVIAARDTLDRLSGRSGPRNGQIPSRDVPPSREVSPFLEGPTLTVAGAALMERVSDAVIRSKGRITSSQVELQGAPFGADFVGVGASIEIAQPHVQALLYDLEAGQPFLFVHQLTARPSAREVDGGGADGQMQLTLTLYGRWQGRP